MQDIHFESPFPNLNKYGIEFFLETRLPGLTASKHFHPALEYIYVIEGRMAIEIERRHQIVAEAGDLVLIHSNEVHAIVNIGDDIGSYYVLKMSPSFLFTVFHKEDILHILPFFHIRNDDINHISGADMPPELQQIWKYMIDEFQAEHSSYWTMQRHLAGISLLICSRHFTTEGKTPMASISADIDEQSLRLISESIYFIHEHYAESLSTKQCARMVHMSYSHFDKLFRAIVGKSFKEYLMNYRMAIAYNLLLTSSMKGSEIARSCGYENHTNFIVAFKKIYSCTPGELRKSKDVHSAATDSLKPSSKAADCRDQPNIACAGVVQPPETVVSDADDCQSATWSRWFI